MEIVTPSKFISGPIEKGHYVAYVEPDVKLPAAERIFLFWDGNRWGYPHSDQNYRGHVYG